MKIALVAGVAVGAWQAGVANVMAASGSLDGSIDAVTGSISGMIRRVAMLGLLIGTADAVVAHRRHRQGLRMTKEQVKQETKNSEGNPHAKAAMRGRAMKLSRSRMMAAVAGADVVL